MEIKLYEFMLAKIAISDYMKLIFYNEVFLQ